MEIVTKHFCPLKANKNPHNSRKYILYNEFSSGNPWPNSTQVCLCVCVCVCVFIYTCIFPPGKNSKTVMLNHLMLNHHNLPKILRISAYDNELWVHASDTFIFSSVADKDSKQCSHKVFHPPHTRHQPVGFLSCSEVSWLSPTENQLISPHRCSPSRKGPSRGHILWHSRAASSQSHI